MKSLVILLAGMSMSSAFAESSIQSGINPLHAGGGSAMTCREGHVQEFRNDGTCAFGKTRHTWRQCQNGRYVIIRQTCESN